MMTSHVTLPDFPKEPWPGAVAGSQPKILVRKEDGMYTAGLSNDELWTRYDSCEDMARQLSAYVSRKMSEVNWSLDDTVNRVEKSVIRKVNDGSWEYSRRVD